MYQSLMFHMHFMDKKLVVSLIVEKGNQWIFNPKFLFGSNRFATHQSYTFIVAMPRISVCLLKYCDSYSHW